MKERTVTFIGHSKCYGLDKDELKKQIVALVSEGKTDFICGGMGEYDHLCARIVYNLKKKHSDIKLFLVIPYLTFQAFDSDIYDEIIYPDGFEHYFFKKAIIKRNRYLVDNSSVAICFVEHAWGGAVKTYRYAKKKGIRIINFGEFE